MKKIVFLILFVVFAISISYAWRNAEMEVRVFYNNQYELAKLAELRLDGDVYPNGEALLFVIPSELEMIKATGLKYKIEREDLNESSRNFWQSMDPTREAYHTYAEIVAMADSLATAFPDICEKHMFGTSVQGRELAALKITDNVSLDENEAEVMFDGGIHGDEIGCSENCIRFARDLCRDYSTDPYIAELIDNHEIWIYYCVNPDGRVADDRENANGVDLNRDSGYMWDGWGGSSGAFSQPESKALRDCHYNRQFVVHTTYHSGTEYISCPWSYRSSQCPDFDHIIQLAGEYSSSSGYANIPYGQGCTGMYPINGSTKDTNYGMMGAISWSMEISYNKHPPASQIQMYYQYNVPAMLSMIEHSGYGLEGIVTDANTGEPVTANVFINDYFPCYTDPVVGDYHKYVLPGTYDITIVANGYESQTITDVTVSANSSEVTDFQLQPLEGQFVYKISASQIPNNNTADEGDTPGVIGAPDSRNYSIGKNGWVVLDMQYPIPDGAGNDIKIFEGDASPEGYTCYVGEFIDGPWYSLGTGNGTTEFDIALSSLIEAQFIKILDDGDGTAIAANAGFDLDAVAALESFSGVYIGLMNYEIDDTAGNSNGRIDPGETVNIVVTLLNNSNIIVEDIEGMINTISPYIILNVAFADFGDLAPDQTGEGVFTITADDITPVGEEFELELDVTANSGAYTNNFTMSFSVGGFLIEEYFDGASYPPTDWSISGSNPGNWSSSSTANAGGSAPESKFSWSPSFVGESALTSPVINTMGFTNLVLTYKHFLNDWSGNGYSIGVKTTSDGGSTWNTVYEVFPTGDIGPEILELTIETSDVGSPTFQIAFFFNGNSFNLDYYYIDNVILEGEAGEFNPPQTLAVECIEDYAHFTWEAPAVDLNSRDKDTKAKAEETRDLTGYNVYLDQVEVANNIPDLEYDFYDLVNGDYYDAGVKAIYDDGTSELVEINFLAEITGAGNILPLVTKLTGNYPNPFNPTTTISFSTKEAGHVSINIYNMKGQLVKTLINENLEEDYHDVIWNGKDNSNKTVSSGIYFYKMKSGNYTATKKMILMK